MIQLIAASVDVSSVTVKNLIIGNNSGNSMNLSDKFNHPYDISMNHSSSLTSSSSSSSSSLYESSSDDLIVSSVSSSSTASPPLLYSTSKDLYSSDVDKMNLSVLIEQKLQTMANPRAIDDSSLIALLIAYTILILLGVTGNGLVCAAVIRKPTMRTGRNVYIINLAISDLLLCIFTMPFTLVDIALKYWPLGGLMCKLVSGLQATSIFVSAISITAIALDRYRVIVNPTREACHPLKTIITLTAIWAFALVLASPLFFYRKVESVDLKDYNIEWLKSLDYSIRLDYCIEQWPMNHGRAFYSIFSMMFQYVIPIITVTVAYMGILRKLKHRMKKATKLTALEEKRKRNRARIKKTNILLLSVAIMFGISWLPLNIVNIVVDIFNPIEGPESDRWYRSIFAICHMIGMSSACSNPLLYGWLNDNFRKEFVDILSKCTPVSFFLGRTLTNMRAAHATNATGMDITEAEAAVLTAGPLSINSNLPGNSRVTSGLNGGSSHGGGGNNNNSGCNSPTSALGVHVKSLDDHPKAQSVTIITHDVVSITAIPVTNSLSVPSSKAPRKVLLEVHSRS